MRMLGPSRRSEELEVEVFGHLLRSFIIRKIRIQTLLSPSPQNIQNQHYNPPPTTIYRLSRKEKANCTVKRNTKRCFWGFDEKHLSLVRGSMLLYLSHLQSSPTPPPRGGFVHQHVGRLGFLFTRFLSFCWTCDVAVIWELCLGLDTVGEDDSISLSYLSLQDELLL